MRWSHALGSVLASACAAAGGTSSGDVDAVDAAAVPQLGFGAPCTADTECVGGLCLESDYSPFAFCSRRCDTPGDVCAEDSGPALSFCAALPDDLVTPGLTETPRPAVCLPLCGDLPACKALSVQWERCDPPTWKGQALYGTAGGLRVCGAPSANGKPITNGDTCEDWQAAWRGQYGPQVGVCEAMCEFLGACDLLAEGGSLDCCGRGCIGRMVDATGGVDVPYEKTQKCFVTSYFGHRGTTSVCKAPAEDCGATPQDPSSP